MAGLVYRSRTAQLLHVLFFLLERAFFFLGQIVIPVFVLGLFIIIVLGDEVDQQRVDLHHLELGLTFGAVENLAFFYFVFVDVNFDTAFGAANQSRTSCPQSGACHQPAYYIPASGKGASSGMSNREYPERPLVGVGGVVIVEGRALLVRRGTPPLLGEWSIPGGLLETGETLIEGVERELLEETGLTVRAVDLIEALERIFPSENGSSRPRYHFVILDYLCERVSGEPQAGGDATEIAFAREDELDRYSLSPITVRVLSKAFAMARTRSAAPQDAP
jgi:8-oxo-dGTP diphosphatase